MCIVCIWVDRCLLKNKDSLIYCPCTYLLNYRLNKNFELSKELTRRGESPALADARLMDENRRLIEEKEHWTRQTREAEHKLKVSLLFMSFDI
jgi:hypothetical protein